MNNINNDEIEKGHSKARWHKLTREWNIVFSGLFRPLVLLPVIISAVALFFANSSTLDKRFSLVLNILSAISLAVAGGFFYDAVITSLGNNLLKKKGLSAVRNLSLARTMIKNISYRANKNGTIEEVINLLSLLEKDIANATQEWNDILPGLDKIEEVYVLLAEKEADLKITVQEKEKLDHLLTEEKQFGDKEKDALIRKLEKAEKRISELNHEIGKLRVTTSSVDIGRLVLPGVVISSAGLGNNLIGADKHCIRCGKSYKGSFSLLEDSGLCTNCQSIMPSTGTSAPPDSSK